MVLKERCGEAVRTLTADEPAAWMGFQIENNKKKLRVSLSEVAWWKLKAKVDLAHEEPNSPVRVFHAIVAWVGQKGPCYPYLDHDAAYSRIGAIAGKHAFDEIPGRSDIKRLWQRAYARWCRMRKRYRDGVRKGAVPVGAGR